MKSFDQLIEQEILVDDLREAESILFQIIANLHPDDEICKVWCIVRNRLQKERQKELEMKKIMEG